MNSHERGMDPVAMTIINPLRENWPRHKSNEQPPVLKLCTIPTAMHAGHLIILANNSPSWIPFFFFFIFTFHTFSDEFKRTFSYSNYTAGCVCVDSALLRHYLQLRRPETQSHPL